MHAEIAARKALAHRDLGEIDRAISILDSAISACTDCSAGYYAKAMIYRDNGQVTEARKVLEQGNRATEDKSPELHYLLGLVLADIKDYEAAQFQAREAYRLGYPQPGLRDRLARAGYAP
jgi:tetratricopeptide (TPR) repeat protein